MEEAFVKSPKYTKKFLIKIVDEKVRYGLVCEYYGERGGGGGEGEGEGGRKEMGSVVKRVGNLLV